MTTNPHVALRRLAYVLTGSLLLAWIAGCGGTRPARLKGQVLDGGQPLSLKGELASLALHKVAADGTPSPSAAYNAVLKPDGSFEMAASGGEMPPGTYRAVIAVVGARGPDRFKGAGTLGTSKLNMELKPGSNDVTLDLANPGG